MSKTVHLNPLRSYRLQDTLRDDEFKFQIVLNESDLWITVPKALPVGEAKERATTRLHELRNELQLWIMASPPFRDSLVPLPLPDKAPQIVLKMCKAAQKAGVGPFAAVAGSIAQMLAESLAQLCADHGLAPEVLVENGGDLFLISQRERIVALLPDPASGASLGLKFGKSDFPLSLCASSGRIGHSLSFGQGDLALVRADDAALADALATAYGNMLRGEDGLQRALKRAEKDAALGVQGVFLQYNGQIGIWGGLELAVL